MEYSGILHEFVDGSLGRGQEEELFARLASDSGLRSELKQLIEMEKAARNDHEAFMPPAQTTASVFSRLGIEQAPAAATGGGIAAFFGKYYTNILSAVISAAATIAIMMTFFNGDGVSSSVDNNYLADIPQQEFNVQIPQQASPAQNTMPDNNIPVVSQREESSNTDRRATKAASNMQSDVSFNDPAAESRESAHIASVRKLDLEPEYLNDIPDNSVAMVLLPATPLNSFRDNPMTAEIRGENVLNGASFLDGLMIEVKDGEYWALPSSSIPRSSEPALENMSILIMNRISDRFAYGVDLRQEFFFQEYEGADQNGLEYKYEQHTNYFALGIVGRYDFLKTNYINSFAQLYVGANKVGPIGRGMIGFEVNPSGNYAFVFGVEGSILRFYHSENYFISPKIGLHYGVKFNLNGGK